MVFIKIRNFCITNKLSQIKIMANKKEEITNSINYKLLLMQHDLRKNRLIPKVNKVGKKRADAFPT
jgi:hypothetical protein